MRKVSIPRRIFVVLNTLFMVLISLICVLPFLHVVFASLSLPQQVQLHQGILLWPIGFNLESYKLVFSKDTLMTGYGVTLFVTFVGTFLSMLLSCFGAYVLSKRGVLLNKIFLRLITITMFISGGMIPFYLLVDGIGLNGSLWALILPYCMSTWNMMVMRSSFRALPESIEESAHIDGASELTILFRIVLPLSVPVLAVMVMFYALNYWNSWFPASLFIRKRDMYPLQLLMREILMMDEGTLNSTVGTGSEINAMGTDEVGAQNYVELLKYTTIVVSTLPIMCVYPFLQKYFVTGILVGSLKE
ncbi:MAG: carbohydrate ABC transporter permease [Clostridiales bacterium]|nr:carbohydrate ABC transporter permease [Clostridiales bacterium]